MSGAGALPSEALAGDVALLGCGYQMDVGVAGCWFGLDRRMSEEFFRTEPKTRTFSTDFRREETFVAGWQGGENL